MSDESLREPTGEEFDNQVDISDDEHERIVGGLSRRQEHAVALLLNEPTIARAAQIAGVGERTLHKWMDEPLFASAYRKARRKAFEHAIAMTQRYATLAVQALAKVITDSKASHAARVSAATAILRFGREGIELEDLAERVRVLEDSQVGEQRHGAAA